MRAARSAGVFAGEAMWTRYLPKFDVLTQVLDSGVLGPIHTVLADHGEHFTADHRIHDPALAGGPLLDLGTYVISLAHMVLGVPEIVDARSAPAADLARRIGKGETESAVHPPADAVATLEIIDRIRDQLSVTP